GRVAVVTGAGSGIGRAVAVELARRGCSLALTDRTVEPLAPVAAEIAAIGRAVSVHGFDVADRAAWPPFVERLRSEHGGVHLVVNNAGVSLTGPFTESSLDDIEWQLGVNLWGVIYGCHFLLPLLREQPDAHLVNVSSIFGIVTVPDNAAYCMSKHAVRSLTEALEVELAGSSVAVSSVHPGAVATRIVLDGRFVAGPRTSPERARELISAGLEPAEAARIIVDGIARGTRRILVGRDAWALAQLHRWLPVWYRDVVRWWVSRAPPIPEKTSSDPVLRD
ncbi:MAG: SDR family oxidoreductase, partial [Myxococcota bacterium]